MSQLPEHLSGLSEAQKRAMLARLIEQSARTVREAPLSCAQRSLWFRHQLAPESPVSNIHLAWRIRSDYDPALLVQALEALIARHATLRTTFASLEGEPRQRIHPVGKLAFEREAATNWSADRLQRQLAQAAARPFDLEAGPLLCVHLFERGPSEDVLLLSVHHIAVDLWSLSVLLDELGIVYRALADGQIPQLPPLKLQYTDYVRWHNDLLEGEEGKELERFWQKELGGELPVISLPCDRPRPPVQTYAGASIPFAIDAALTAQLRALARREKTTLYTVLLAALQVLLSRLTGQEDLLVASPTTGRSRADLADLVGYFANPVVLRADLGGNPRFDAFLARVRSRVLAALDHQDYPFALLVERRRCRRDPSRSPLSEVMFVLEKPHRQDQAAGADGALPRLDLNGLVLESYPLEWTAARGDLDWMVIEAGPTLEGQFLYNSDLFDRSTIERFARSLRTLLEGIVAAPWTPVAELPLLDEAERRRMLVEWNDTAWACPTEPVYRLFEAWVKVQPEAIAARAGESQLTYCELNERANRLARHLQSLGVGPEVRVGVCVERELEVLVALLAILKAGGAYVPMDPSYPTERLAFMNEDAEVKVLLTQGRLVDVLPLSEETTVVFLDDISAFETYHPTDLESQPEPGHLAYLVYTSGTTGRPKAVMAEHHNLTHYLLATSWRIELKPDDVLACAASFAFSISLFELLAPLVTGGKLVLLDQGQLLDLERLAAALEGLTSIHLTPGLLRQLNDYVERRGAAYPQLRQILTGGDGVAPALVREVQRTFTPAQVWVFYGCSEGSTLCTAYRVPPEFSAQRSPIGKPLPNVRVRLCDPLGQPVPVGVMGEIYVGGAAVTRGYAGREELTRERYVLLDGERYYRTGDLGCYRPDGTIEFLGRRDYQVKIRGFRVEPAEVEAALTAHPAVRQAVVVARETAEGDRKLIAYLSTRLGESVVPSQLRSFLQHRLPDYMVPVAFVVLEALPLTANKKIDRNALPEPALAREAEALAPRTPVEEKLTRIWASLLKVEKVGIHDNFFELGGHSLLATQLVSRIRAELQVDLALQQLFEAPTVADLAACLQEGTAEVSVLAIVPLKRTVDHFPLSYAQQFFWLLEQLDPGRATFNVPIAMRLSGDLDAALLKRVMDEVVCRHESLRTTFCLVEGKPAQRIAPPWPVALPLVDLTNFAVPEREAEAMRHLREAAQQPFDLSTGSLLRLGLLRLGTREHILQILAHHIVLDDWSIGVLVGEVSALYAALREGRPSPLAPLAVQYADFSHWQRECLERGAFGEDLAYWQAQLGDRPAPLALPTDRPRPPRSSFQGAQHSFLISRPLSDALQSLGRGEGATLFMTLLAAFAVLLHRYTGQEDLLISAPVANRTRPETEVLIGCLINQLVLRTDLSGTPSFRQLLSRVRAVTLAAYDRQELPFEKLVEHLQPDRTAGHNALVQVQLTLLSHTEPFSLPGLEVQLVPFEPETIQLDLQLQVMESEAGLALALRYSTDLFDASTAARMAAHFETLLRALIADPDAPVAQLPMLSAEEQQLAVRNAPRPPALSDRLRSRLHQTLKDKERRSDA